MKKCSLIILIIALFACFAQAAEVSQSQAELAVKGWLNLDSSPLSEKIGDEVDEIEIYSDAKSKPLYYVVNLKPSGFVIVSAEDEVEPIVAFANDGEYVASVDNPLGALVINGLAKNVVAVRESQASQNVKSSDAENKLKNKAKTKWQNLIDSSSSAHGGTTSGDDENARDAEDSVDDMVVEALVQSEWDQSLEFGLNCYNYYTPNNYVCGCVATAGAQIMRFHEFPVAGIGEVNCTYTVSGGASQAATTRGGDGSGGAYNWANMPLDPQSGITDAQRQAIGGLCYDVGIASKMNYGTDAEGGSGAFMYDLDDALTTTFQFSNSIINFVSSSDDYKSMINANLNAGYPVALGITGTVGGHAIVADGYGYNFSTLYHHLNMGWSGTDNVWYNLPDVGTFDSVQDITYNIFKTGNGEVLSGRVTYRGNPVAGVTVSITDSAAYNDSTTTNQYGIYAFEVASNATYSVSVAKTGFISSGAKNYTLAASYDGVVTGEFITDFGASANIGDADFVLKVDGDPGVTINFPGQYSTLQETIDAAYDGDTIVVAPGLQPYYITQTVVIEDKAITIRSEDPTNPEIVAATEFQAKAGINGYLQVPFRFIDCEADTVFSGFTISYLLGESANASSGLPGAQPTEELPDLEIDGGDGGSITGGAIVLLTSSPTLRYLHIKDCKIVAGSGALGATGEVVEEGDPAVTVAHDAGNGGLPGAARGGGIYCEESSPKLYYCRFENLTVQGGSGGDGGAGAGDANLAAAPGEAQAPNEELDGYSGSGGAVYVDGDSSPEFYYCTFEDCYSISGVSGICGVNIVSGLRNYPNLHYNIKTSGGAVFCEANSEATFENCTFSNNEAETDIEEYNDDSYVSFGGAICSYSNSVVRLTDCEFTGNKATMGGACYSIGTDMEITDSEFRTNTAYSGGGVYSSTSDYLKLLRVVFEDNTAVSQGVPVGSGGAVYVWDAAANIVDSTFKNNTANINGGAVYFGGYDAIGGKDMLLRNNLVINNNAGGFGGGIYATSNAVVKISHATVAGNNADFGGGLGITYGANVEVVNSIFWENYSSDPNNADQIEVGVYSHDTDPETPKDASVMSTLDIEYSNVMNGQSGVNIYQGELTDPTDNAEMTWGTGMLTGYSSSRPWFITGENGDYYLNRNQEDNPYDIDSPCIDAGKVLALPDNDPFNAYRHTTDTEHVIEAGTPDIGYYNVLMTDYDGDLDFSNLVNLDDLQIIVDMVTTTGCEFPDWCSGADLDEDTIVNNTDVGIFAASWQTDNTAPWPNPLKWEIKPRSTLNSNKVYMRVVDAEDNTGYFVTYKFSCYNPDGSLHGAVVSQDEDEDDLEAVEAREYEFSGLTIGQEYGFDVVAKDNNLFGTENTTDATSRVYIIVGDDYSPPSPETAQWLIEPVPASYSSIRMSAVIANDTNGVEYYFRYVSGIANNDGELAPGHDSLWQDSNEYVDTGLTAGARYTYSVQTRDKSAHLNSGIISEEASVRIPTEGETFDFDPPSTPYPVYYGQELDNYADGVYHYMKAVAASTDDTEIVYYGFECKDDSRFNTYWHQEDSEIHYGGYTGSTYALWFADGDVLLRIKVRSLENGAAALPLKWRVVAVDQTGKKSYSSWYYLNDPH